MITNKDHKRFIEETGDFRLAESLELSHCGLCAVVGTLVLVSEDTTSRRFHEYGGRRRCLTLPVCPNCEEEMESEPDPGMVRCGTRGCQSVVEEWRAQQAVRQQPLFYGYEAYPKNNSHHVSIDQDNQLADTLQPAGDIRVFATEKEREAWVEDGPTVTENEYGCAVSFRSRSAISARVGSRLYVPEDEALSP